MTQAPDATETTGNMTEYTVTGLITPDGKLLVSGTYEGHIESVGDAETPGFERFAATVLAVTPEEAEQQALLCAVLDGVSVADLAPGVIIADFGSPQRRVATVTPTPDGAVTVAYTDAGPADTWPSEHVVLAIVPR